MTDTSRGSRRSDKVNHPPGDRGRTGATEKENMDGDGRKVVVLRQYFRFALSSWLCYTERRKKAFAT